MSLVLSNITFDCDEPTKVGEFWAAAMGLALDDAPAEIAPFFRQISTPKGAPNWLFIKVPEPKTVKNRQHLDLGTADRPGEHERLLSLGATHVGDYDEYGHSWSTYLDVEGNEFCVG